jgi:predicted nucleic acid-binding protein
VIYLLDTNVISDLMEQHPNVRNHAIERINDGNSLAICRPVHYEILRGLFWRNASGQLRRFQRSILPLFTWIDLENVDWEVAARFWADARRNGKQLGDPDLLLAALTLRVGGTLVSSDADFDALAIPREDWRHPKL